MRRKWSHTPAGCTSSSLVTDIQQRVPSASIEFLPCALVVSIKGNFSADVKERASFNKDTNLADKLNQLTRR